MTDVLPEVLPDGSAVQQQPRTLLMILALVGALLIGAGSAVVIYTLVDDEPLTVPQTVTAPAKPLHVTTADEIAAAKAMTKDEAATAVAISPRPDARVKAPTGSLAGTTSQTARTEAAQHAATMQRLGVRANSGTPANGKAAQDAGTAFSGDQLRAAKIQAQQYEAGDLP